MRLNSSGMTSRTHCSRGERWRAIEKDGENVLEVLYDNHDVMQPRCTSGRNKNIIITKLAK